MVTTLVGPTDADTAAPRSEPFTAESPWNSSVALPFDETPLALVAPEDGMSFSKDARWSVLSQGPVPPDMEDFITCLETGSSATASFLVTTVAGRRLFGVLCALLAQRDVESVTTSAAALACSAFCVAADIVRRMFDDDR